MNEITEGNAEKMPCDLHTHSTFSDGTRTPTELIAEACKIGLSAIALTDHNSVNGIEEFLTAAEDKPITAIPGVELSTDCHGTELHLVGLFIPRSALNAVNEYTREYLKRKDDSNRLLCARLAAAGYRISYDDIVRRNIGAAINRAQIAEALVNSGAFTSIPEATRRILLPGHGFYEPPIRPSVFDAIRMLRSVGAVPVLAHPFLNEVQRGAAELYLPELITAGLQGIEVRYVTYTEEQTQTVRALAERYDLLPSGGSDYHGGRKQGIDLGVGRGNLYVPDAYAEVLHRCAQTNIARNRNCT